MSLNRFKTDIKLERRRRNQTYLALDYILQRVTYFDFFSSDAFNIAKYSKSFAQLFEKKVVTSEILLFPFFYCDSSLLKLLKEYALDEKFISFLHSQMEKEVALDSKRITKRLETEIYNEDFPYYKEINLIFERAAENALKRFKTPVITSEILFLTMMEEKETKVSKIIKKILQTDVEWELLKYRLLRELHHNEAFIKSEISKNQQYFAYLLKTELPEEQFKRLVQTETLEKGIQLFRNVLVRDILKINIFELLFEDIQDSIKITSNRKYSS